MYAFDQSYQRGRQWYPRDNQGYFSQSSNQAQPPLSHSSPANAFQSGVRKDPKMYSNSDLKDFLAKRTNILKNIKDQEKQLPIIVEALSILIGVPKSILLLAVQDENEFFSLLRTPFIALLNQWCNQSTALSEDQVYVLRVGTKLIRRLMKIIDEIESVPSWLSDSSFLQATANTLVTISTLSNPFAQSKSKSLKYIIRLFDAYISYQDWFISPSEAHKDTLDQLVSPVFQCLSSSHFTAAFLNTSTSSSMTSIEKFFLQKCPLFLISYNGSQLNEMMSQLLSKMLPEYIQLLNQLVPNAHRWDKKSMTNVDYLLQLLNHAVYNSQRSVKLVSEHFSFVDHVLKLVDEPSLYNHLQETLGNVQTSLMHSCVNFLVTMINDPLVLTHIKECHVVDRFLRLTSCKYEPLVLHVYTLLAFTTREDDIKAMGNPGRLLSTIVNSLKVTLKKTPDEQTQKEELLETLKGLIQHDQMKDEVIKQNTLPFLLQCTNQLTDKERMVLLEILWALTFREEGFLALRSNQQFLQQIQSVSKTETDDGLKKAADGLIWKLVQEPAHLEKVAKREEEEKAARQTVETVFEEIIKPDGQRELVATVKPVVTQPEERVFQYDIMISYCHSDQELIYKIHQFLTDQGFKIWIDLNNMHGPTMSAMADAVENSEFVVMCMSDAYKRSTFCQAEAEYAFNRKRRLLPLIARPGYQPDGWLGFLIGSRFYIDFGRFEFNLACEKLLKEISLQRKQALPLKPLNTNPPAPPTTTSVAKKNNEGEEEQSLIDRSSKSTRTTTDMSGALITYTNRKAMANFNHKPPIHWTDADVLDFLFTERLIQLMPLCDTMDGRALLQFYQMCLKGTVIIYTLLKHELKSTYKMKLPIVVYTRFLSAMEQRLSIHPSMEDSPVSTRWNRIGDFLPLLPPSTNNRTPASSRFLEDSSDSKQPPYSSEPFYSNQKYDLLITSDAPAMHLLRTIERYGLNSQKLLAIQAPFTNRS